MAKVSRSSRKQPAFDPRELEDLILTPAVGSGVGSHLLSGVRADGADTSTMDRFSLPTVDMQHQTTEDECAGPTVVTLEGPSPALADSATVELTEESTVDTFSVATVDDTATATVDNSAGATVDKSAPLPVDMTDVATVDMSAPASGFPAPPPLWITESGEFVPQSRVKRIRLAQDAINSAEESVYDTLWRARVIPEPGADADVSRCVQAGYDYLSKKTRLSRKTIQRIIDKLIAKEFIEIARPADIYTRAATVYRVFGYRTVLDRLTRKGRLNAAKIGPGIVFVRPFADPRVNLATVVTSDVSTPPITHLSTVAMPPATTVDISSPSRVPENRPTTLARPDSSTVVRMATHIGRNTQGNPSPASPAEIRKLRGMVEAQLGIVDDGAVAQLLRDCRRHAADCTLEEIAYFVEFKLRSVRNVQNPVGLVLAAVPRHFENQGHAVVRELLRKQSRRRDQEWRDVYAFWKGVAEDPGQPDDQRSEAVKVLRDMEVSPDRPAEWE